MRTTFLLSVILALGFSPCPLAENATCLGESQLFEIPYGGVDIGASPSGRTIVVHRGYMNYLFDLSEDNTLWTGPILCATGFCVLDFVGWEKDSQGKDCVLFSTDINPGYERVTPQYRLLERARLMHFDPLIKLENRPNEMGKIAGQYWRILRRGVDDKKINQILDKERKLAMERRKRVGLKPVNDSQVAQNLSALVDLAPTKQRIIYSERGLSTLFSGDLISDVTYSLFGAKHPRARSGSARFSRDGEWILASFSYGDEGCHQYLELYTWKGEFVEPLCIYDWCSTESQGMDYRWLADDWIAYSSPGVVLDRSREPFRTAPGHIVFRKFSPPEMKEDPKD